MERRASDNEVICGVPPTQQFTQQLTEHVNTCIKQEAAEDHCSQNTESFSENCEDYFGNLHGSLTKQQCKAAQGYSPSLNYEAHLTFNEDEEKGQISTKFSPSMIKSAINDDDQVGGDPWSLFSASENITSPIKVKQEETCKIEVEDHKFEPEIGKQEAYDERTECFKQAELLKHCTRDVDDADKLYAGPLLDTRYIKAEYDPEDMVRQAGSEHSSQVEVFVCSKCDYSVTDKDRFARHTKRYHNDTVQNRCKTKRQKKPSVNTKVQHPAVASLYKCPVCDFTTKWRHYLSKHVSTRHDPNAKLYECTICDFVTKDPAGLRRHITGKHDRPASAYQCATCNYRTSRKACLHRHMKHLHNKSAECHKCVHCDYTTRFKYDLNKHVKTKHDPDAELYKCTMCDFATKHANSLRYHVSGKHNPHALVYRCSMCSDASFKCERYLATHIKVVHNKGAEYHQCSQCAYVTKYKHCLLKHVKVQHSPDALLYRCSVCEFETKYANCLKKHVTRKHNSDAPIYRCARCWYMTKFKYDLCRHFVHVHDKHRSTGEEAKLPKNQAK